jgi:hypothetical protein
MLSAVQSASSICRRLLDAGPHLLAGLVSAGVSACDRAPQEPPSPSQITTAAEQTPPQEKPAKERQTGVRRTIDTGEFVAGTHPAEFEWRPDVEPLPFRIKLGEYDEAASWCSARGGRLCTELEWERACRGPEQHPFAGGRSADACTPGSPCESGFGVVDLGGRPEWTASRFGSSSEFHGKPVLRGKPAASTERTDERCSNRHPAPDSATEAAVRCCYGAPNAARVEEPIDYKIFERPDFGAARLRKLLESDPLTAPLAKDLILFSDPEATNTVISRGPGDRKGFDFSTGPLLWSPTLGARFLVVGGKSGKDRSFVLAYYVLPDDQYALASSYIMDNEVGPITFAYSESIRPRIHFSSCWGCPGETGKLLFRKPARVTFLQP